MCKTKPISRRGRAALPRPSTFRPRPCQADRAKRSQFPTVPGETRSERRGLVGRLCKTKPIPGRARRDEAWRTKAVEGNRAKQTQFGPRCPEMGADRQARGLGRGRLCKTKPIPGGGRGGAIVRNKANLRGFGRRARASSLAPHSSGLPWVNCAKQSQFTPAPTGKGAGRQGRKCYRRWDDRTKQTQLSQSEVKVKYFLKKEL
jgi:hypothetical protein